MRFIWYRFINTEQISKPLGFSNIIQSKNLNSWRAHFRKHLVFLLVLLTYVVERGSLSMQIITLQRVISSSWEEHTGQRKLGFAHINHYCFFASSSTAWKPIVSKQFPWSSLSWDSKSNSSSHSHGCIPRLKESKIRSGEKHLRSAFFFLSSIPFLKCSYTYLSRSTLSSQITFHIHKMVLTMHRFLFDFFCFILPCEPWI